MGHSTDERQEVLDACQAVFLDTSRTEGRGTYLVCISLPMAGPWMVRVSMQAKGFVPLDQTLLVQVPSASALISPVGTVRPEARCSS